jgi:hypothetical protein
MKALFTALIAILFFGLTAIAEPTNSQKLAGVWSWQLENMRCTNIVAINGSFTGQAVFIHLGRTNTYQMAGMWQIKDGRFIESITSDSNKTAQVPRSHTGQIFFANTNEFVVSWQGSTNKTVWQRVSP